MSSINTTTNTAGENDIRTETTAEQTLLQKNTPKTNQYTVEGCDNNTVSGSNNTLHNANDDSNTDKTKCNIDSKQQAMTSQDLRLREDDSPPDGRLLRRSNPRNDEMTETPTETTETPADNGNAEEQPTTETNLYDNTDNKNN